MGKYFALLFSVVCFKSMAQVELKLYQNTDFYSTTYNSFLSPSVTDHHVNFNRVSLAASLQRKKFAHELELFIPDIDRPSKEVSYPMNYELNLVGTYVDRVSSYSFRYSISKKLYQKDRVAVSLGGGINPYYTKFSYISTQTNFYDIYQWYMGVALNVTPGVSYSLFPNVKVHLSVPLKIFDARESRGDVENPQIPIAQKSTSKWEYKFFENAYTIRLGIGLSI